MKKIDRRKFLKGSLAGGVVAATTGVSRKSHAAHSLEGYPDSMGVLVDLTKCVG